MKILRTVSIVTAAILVISVFGYRELRAYLARSLNEAYLRHTVAEFVRNNFNRAVIVDAVRLEKNGVLSIYNMRISSENDFNDNKILLIAPKIELRLHLLPLLKKQIRIKNIAIQNAEFSVLKHHTGDYRSAFYLFTIIHHAFSKSGSSAAQIVLNDCRFNYHEQFQSSTQKIIFEKINGEAAFLPDKLRFDLKGLFGSNGGDSSVSAKGEILYSGKDSVFEAMTLNCSLRNIPLDPVNAYIENKAAQNYALGGNISADIAWNSLRDSHSCTLSTRFNGLTLMQRNPESNTQLLLPSSAALSCVIDILYGGKRILIKNARLSGTGIEGSADLKLSRLQKSSYIAVINGHSEIDFERLSDILSLPAGSTYQGKLSFESSLATSKNRKLHYLYAKAKSDSFAYEQPPSDAASAKKFQASIDAYADPLYANITASYQNDISEIIIKNSSKVINWSPLTTQSTIDIDSRVFSAKDIYSSLSYAYHWFTDQAIKDTKTGYDDIFFKDKPYGLLINNNDLDLNIRFDKIAFGPHARSGPLKLRLKLDQGELTTPDFSFDCFSGIYSFFVKGSFNADYARITSRASIEGLDLEQLYKAHQGEGRVSGKLSANMQFDENGYGLKHFVLSNICTFSITGESLFFENTAFNRRLDKIINADMKRADLASVSLNTARFRMAQSMLVYPVNEFSANGSPISFSSQGSFEYGIGFEIPFVLSTPSGQLRGYFSGMPHNMTVNFPDGRIFSLASDYLSAPERI